MNWMAELRLLLAGLKVEESMGGPPGGIPCHEATERIFEWLDGELSPELTEKVGTHLETCARCYPRLLFEQAFRDALVRAGGNQRAPEELERRILGALQAEGFTVE